MRRFAVKQGSWLIAAVSALALLTGCGKGGPDGAFARGFVKSFTDKCAGSAVKSGAPQQLATTVCTCTAEELVKTKSTTELIAMSDADMMPAFKQCARQQGMNIP